MQLKFILLILFVSASHVFAQGSVLKPYREPIHMELPIRAGAFIGIQHNRSNGSFSTTCDCKYENGSGWGSRFGVIGEYPFEQSISLTGTLSLGWSPTSYGRTESRIEYVYNEGRYANVRFHSIVEVQLVTLDMRIQFTWQTPFDRLFAGVGVRGGFVLDDNIRESEEALTPDFTYRSSNARTIQYLDGSLSELYTVTKIRMGLEAAVHYEIPIALGVKLAPELSYFYPLTPVVKDYDQWNITSATLSCILLYVL